MTCRAIRAWSVPPGLPAAYVFPDAMTRSRCGTPRTCSEADTEPEGHTHHVCLSTLRQPRYPYHVSGPVALRPCLATGLPFKSRFESDTFQRHVKAELFAFLRCDAVPEYLQ